MNRQGIVGQCKSHLQRSREYVEQGWQEALECLPEDSHAAAKWLQWLAREIRSQAPGGIVQDPIPEETWNQYGEVLSLLARLGLRELAYRFSKEQLDQLEAFMNRN